jgi:hypothetical protein
MDAYAAFDFIVRSINLKNKSKFAKRIRKKHLKNKGFRVPEYEDFLINDVEVCCQYAFHIVRGKLPEKMHNRIICESLVNPKSPFISDYFRFIKK